MKTGTGIIDAKGKTIVEAVYEDIDVSNGYFILKSKEEQLGLAACDGHMMLHPSSGYERIDFLSDSIVAAFTSDKRSYLNLKSGKIIWSEAE